MHFWTATDARPGLFRVVRAAINVANSFKISTCSWLLWRPRSRARLSLLHGFLCMSIPAVAIRLSTTHRRPISCCTLSLVYVNHDLLGNWAHDCVEFWLHARYLLGINFFRLDRSCSASWVSRPRVFIAQQLLIDCARYQRMIVRTRSHPMHCTLRRRYFGRIIIGNSMWWCGQVLRFWCHQALHHPSDLCVCVPQIESVILLFLE